MLLISLLKALGAKKKNKSQEEMEEIPPQVLALNVEPVPVRRRQARGLMFPEIKRFFKNPLSIQESNKNK